MLRFRKKTDSVEAVCVRFVFVALRQHAPGGTREKRGGEEKQCTDVRNLIGDAGTLASHDHEYDDEEESDE